MIAGLDFAEWKWDLFGLLGGLGVAALQKVWRDSRQRRSETWPISYGRINDVDVDSKDKKTTLELHYSYRVNSETYVGSFRKDFDDPDEAHGWAKALDGKQVAVRHNPDKDSASQLRETDLEPMVKAAAPLMLRQAEENRLLAWERSFVWLGLVVAIVGVAATMAILLGEILGRPPIMDTASKILWQGAIVLLFFALLESHRGGKRVAHSIPPWMKYLGYGLVYYVILSAALFSSRHPRQRNDSGQPTSRNVAYSDVRYRMLLYFSAAELLYGRLRAEQRADDIGQSLYGHGGTQSNKP
jgi:hypothetical protein